MVASTVVVTSTAAPGDEASTDTLAREIMVEITGVTTAARLGEVPVTTVDTVEEGRENMTALGAGLAALATAVLVDMVAGLVAPSPARTAATITLVLGLVVLGVGLLVTAIIAEAAAASLVITVDLGGQDPGLVLAVVLVITLAALVGVAAVALALVVPTVVRLAIRAGRAVGSRLR